MDTTKPISIRPTWTSADIGPDFWGCLYSREPINIAGADVYLQAFQVERDDDGTQLAANGVWADEVDRVQSLCGGYALQTTTIDGHPGEWIVVAFPRGD